MCVYIYIYRYSISEVLPRLAPAQLGLLREVLEAGVRAHEDPGTLPSSRVAGRYDQSHGFKNPHGRGPRVKQSSGLPCIWEESAQRNRRASLN